MDSSNSETSPSTRRPHWLDFVNTVLLATALVAMVLGVRHAWQRADAAVLEARVQQERAREEMRAYVMVEPNGEIELFEAGRVSGFPLLISNVGQTPARSLRITVRGFAEESEDTGDWVWRRVAKDSIAVSVGFLSGDLYQLFKPARTIDTHAVQRDGRHIFLLGVVYYDDVFGEEHWTSFCFRWVDGAALGVNDSSHCDRYNATDNTN